MNKNSGDKMTTDMRVCRKDSLMEERWGSWAEGQTPAMWRCQRLAMHLSFVAANVSYLTESLLSEFCNERPSTAQHSPSSDIYSATGQETVLTHMYEFMST